MSIYECQCNCAACPLLCECPCAEDWDTCPVNELVGKMEAIQEATYRGQGDLLNEITDILEGKKPGREVVE